VRISPLTGLRATPALLAVLTLCSAFHAGAQRPSLDELEMEFLLEQASQAFEKNDLSIEQISADFKFRCLRAVGDPVLCDCLVKRRPYILRFEQYVTISSSTRAELGYSALSDNGKSFVDKVYRVRDECVARQ
jgi:hypothetical protein